MTLHKRIFLILLTISWVTFTPTWVSAFIPYSATTQHRNNISERQTENAFKTTTLTPKLSEDTNEVKYRGRMSLCASVASAPVIAKTTSKFLPIPPVIRNALLVSFALLFVLQRQRILYPGSFSDRSYTEPLPPGTINGCPWVGSLSMLGDINTFLSKKSASLGKSPPNMFKMFGFGQPMIIVSGSSAIKKFLGREFKKEHGVSQPQNFGNEKFVEAYFGHESMSFETSSAKKYHFLQKIVGQALTPESVAKGIPALQKASEESVDRMLASESVVMSDINHRLTLDVAWRQIIGLDLKNDEVDNFHKNVQTWLSALTNYINFVLPIPMFLLKRTKSFKAKQALTRLIEDKMDDLVANGPDGSTISAMVFASDEEDPSKKLTRQQVIDNVFLLIVAGSETSSLTLTNAMLLMGMKPIVWEKLVKEQEDLVAKHGETLTKKQLDEDCPYLDAVVKETMRILPISGGGARMIDDTIIMDGVQLPKKWLTMYSVGLTHEHDPKTKMPDGSHMSIDKGFQPERWLDSETRPTTEYIPWGAGHRFCLGHHLASAEMRTFLAIMARKIKSFDLLTDVESMKWKEGVIKTPKDGVVVSAHKM